MADKDDLGRAGEQRAARYLTEQGYTILDRNWRCAQGEIDLVATKGARLAFVEVKRRSTCDEAAFAVTARQERRIVRAAQYWIASHPEYVGHPIAFDVVHTAPEVVFSSVCRHLLERDLAAVGDIVIFTEGMISGVKGGTNTMKILHVVEPGGLAPPES
jgi:putative endonuclease